MNSAQIWEVAQSVNLNDLKNKLLGIFQVDAMHLRKMLFQALSHNFSTA